MGRHAISAQDSADYKLAEYPLFKVGKGMDS